MSTTTIRKRVSLSVVTALIAGVLTSVTASSVANAHGGVVGTGASNASATSATANQNLYVAEKNSATVLLKLVLQMPLVEDILFIKPHYL
jgi:hypothetical protein